MSTGLRPYVILCDYQLALGIIRDEIVVEIASLLGVKPPTIVLSGDISDRHIEKAWFVADRMLPKPVDINLLLAKIETLIGRRD
jgi:DNA-binding response OmpR family regulator